MAEAEWSKVAPAEVHLSTCWVWAAPDASRAKLGSCLLTGMLGREDRLARFLRGMPMFLRGLFVPVGTD